MISTTKEIRACADWLQRMMESMYAGQSVRTSMEFRQDVDALLLASRALRDYAADAEELERMQIQGLGDQFQTAVIPE